MKLYFSFFYLFWISQTLAQRPIIIGVPETIKYKINLTEKQKAEYELFLKSYQNIVFQTLDSLCKKDGNILKRNKEGIIFSLVVYQEDSSTIQKFEKILKNKIAFSVMNEISYPSHVKNETEKGSGEPIFEQKIEAKSINQEDILFLKNTIENSYRLYIPKLENVIKKELIKNSPKKNHSILIEKPKNNKNEIVYILLSNLFIHNQKNANIYFPKDKISSKQNLTTINYSLKEEGENYVLEIQPKGKNLILIYPREPYDKILKPIKFNKKRFDTGDYSEFGYLLNPDISSFTILNK